jgi:hypothetical protein
VFLVPIKPRLARCGICHSIVELTNAGWWAPVFDRNDGVCSACIERTAHLLLNSPRSVLSTLWRIRSGSGLLEPVSEARIEYLRSLEVPAGEEWSFEERRWVPEPLRPEHPIDLLRRRGTLDEALYMAAHSVKVGDPFAKGPAEATFYFPKAVQEKFASRLREVVFPT